MKNRSAIERFSTHVEFSPVPEDCWHWTGALHGGYGRFKSVCGVDGKTCAAHRFAFEAWVGPIPAGLDLDHVCRNRACVNPAHLEPVTRSENMRRSPLNRIRARAMARRRSEQTTHCAQGHQYDEANTRRKPNGSRYCRACNNDRARARRLRPDAE